MALRHSIIPRLGKSFGLFLLVGLLTLTRPCRAADGGEKDASLPPVFAKAVPENKQDLLAIQKHIKRLLKHTLPATVGVIVGAAQGSGVIVSKDGIVLTAGHVSALPDRKCQIIMPDGRILKGKTLGADHAMDSGMIQITDKGEYPFCEMGSSADVKPGDWCLAIGHPGGWQKGRSPVVRLGRVQSESKSFIQTDCALVGGDSGGPLFDMHGKVIGIHSRIGNLITANLHVPVDTYRSTWDRLAAGEEWGSDSLITSARRAKTSDAYMGLSLDPDAKDCRIVTVNEDSPAAKAGLRVNDIVRKFDNEKIRVQDDLFRLMRTKHPGNQVTIEVVRGEDIVILRVTLGKRPG